MTTITNPQVGATITTYKGNGGIVERLENERAIIRIADGILKSIPVAEIAIESDTEYREKATTRAAQAVC